MDNIMVSICCITYNHKLYIKDCIDGFLMQQCDFNFEILIHDDASIDGTSEIIREYERKYPDIIKSVIQKENQYSKGIKNIQSKWNFTRAKGKYIAMCEGDDYWTDPLKLQKQVNFLESHLDYSLVAGGYVLNDTSKGEECVVIKKIKSEEEPCVNGYDITLDRQLDNWLTKTLTLVFRRSFLDEFFAKKYQYGKDVHLNYHLLKRGYGFYLTEVLGVYRVHEGGVFSLESKDSRLITAYNLAEELYYINKDRYSRKLYGQSIRNVIKAQLYKRKADFRRIPLFFNLLFLTRDRVELGAFIWLLFKG